MDEKDSNFNFAINELQKKLDEVDQLRNDISNPKYPNNFINGELLLIKTIEDRYSRGGELQPIIDLLNDKADPYRRNKENRTGLDTLVHYNNMILINGNLITIGNDNKYKELTELAKKFTETKKPSEKEIPLFFKLLSNNRVNIVDMRLLEHLIGNSLMDIDYTNANGDNIMHIIAEALNHPKEEKYTREAYKTITYLLANNICYNKINNNNKIPIELIKDEEGKLIFNAAINGDLSGFEKLLEERKKLKLERQNKLYEGFKKALEDKN